MTVVSMSHDELERFDTLLRVERGELRAQDAATRLGLCRRQIYRLLIRMRGDGAAGLVSRRRGLRGNRWLGDEFRNHVVALVREHYSDFGPTLAAEYLAERHDVHISRETLRKLMIETGLWKDRAARRPRPYQPRYRRDCRGELIQIDGSKHWWFEDRGPQCTLLVYIDDATSELMHLKMVESESTFAYMEATCEYIQRHGKPVAFYSDQHSVFRNSRASAARGDGMTHFGRALDALNIEIICANSPQAKGRVERANSTLQDRLVKAMRLEGLSSIAEANAFLASYMARHNERFARPAFDARDLHRPLASHDDLRSIMVWREQRTVTAALTLHYNKALFILEPNEISQKLARKRVTVCEYPDGRLEIQHEGHVLPYRHFDKMRQVNQPAIVENRHLDAALLLAKQIQAIAPHHRQRNNDAPVRHSQPTHLFPEPEAPPKIDRRRLVAPNLNAAHGSAGPSFTVERAYVDRGYKGHKHGGKTQVYIAHTRGITSPTIKRELRRRNAIESVIGHTKSDGLLECNHLAGVTGDAINAILVAAGHNLRLLVAWLTALLRALFNAWLPATRPEMVPA